MNAKARCGRPRRKIPDARTPEQVRQDRLNKRRQRGLKVAETFDALPDSARCGIEAVEVLLNLTTVTLWRRIRDGKLPKFGEDGGKRYYTAGQLRSILGGK